VSRMDFTVEPVTSAQWPALEDLFGRSGGSNGCWCMYWRIGPRHRDRPRADNKDDLRRPAASGRALEAYPVDTAVPSHTGNLFPGIVAAFARHGFQVAARRKPDRPVMRKILGPA